MKLQGFARPLHAIGFHDFFLELARFMGISRHARHALSLCIWFLNICICSWHASVRMWPCCAWWGASGNVSFRLVQTTADSMKILNDNWNDFFWFSAPAWFLNSVHPHGRYVPALLPGFSSFSISPRETKPWVQGERKHLRVRSLHCSYTRFIDGYI